MKLKNNKNNIHNTMQYPKVLKVSQMKKLNLFDDIQYRYVKGLDYDDDVDVEIEDLESDKGVAYRKTIFKITLEDWEDMLCLGEFEFRVIKEYCIGSNYAVEVLELKEN